MDDIHSLPDKDFLELLEAVWQEAAARIAAIESVISHMKNVVREYDSKEE